MQLYARRRHAAVLQRCRRALLVVAAAALLLLLVVFLPSGGPPLSFAALPKLALSPARALLVPPRRLHLRLGAVAERRSATPPPPTPPEDQSEAVLMPDWEVLVLLRAGAGAGEEKNATCCAFRGGATSPARARGKLTPSGRHAYVCVLPEKARRRRKLAAPRLVFSGSGHGEAARSLPELEKEKEMVRWSGRLVYSSAVVHNDDDDQDGVLVFAKGVNPQQGVNRAASDIRCVYYHRRRAGAGDEDVDVVASLPAATSAQQVFRCPPPPPAASSSSSSSSTSQQLRVTLAIAGEETPIPSLAIYTPPPPTIGDSLTAPEKKEKKLICACTMVRDVAKFLGEWVAYHAAVGVDRFFVYDNGSEDDLSDRVRRLNEAGYDVSTVAWPWAKAQEAGFSHAAAEHRDSCEWMAFVDVDEFIFSPRWVESKKPAKSMLRSVVSVQADVGQVSLGCANFGPSGRTANPKEGVTQGYMCRKRTEERHKSLVRLDAVDRSLVNSVHHFALRPGFRGEWNRQVRVNHYKYQAWEEFKVKFRRRVSTYVADWTDPVNLQSKDRTPGLGFEAVEPVGWTQKFCEVNDTLLRDATRRWFGVGFGNKLARPQTHSSS